MKTQSKKAKGTRLEKLFAKMLVDAGIDKYAMRMPLSGAIKGLQSDIYTKLPFAFECKNQETSKFYQWFQQAEAGKNIGDRKTPVVIWSKNRINRTFAFLDAQDLVNLIDYAIKGGLLND